LLAHEILSHCQSLTGDYAGAAAHAKRASQLSHNSPWSEAMLAIALARAGHRADAQMLLEHLKEAPEAKSRADFLALVEIALGHKNEAFAWLDRAHEARLGALILLDVEPFWDYVRSDPRFERLRPRPLPKIPNGASGFQLPPSPRISAQSLLARPRRIAA
jgi:hypothetical protein